MPLLVLFLLLCVAGVAVAWYAIPHNAARGIDAAAGDALLRTSGLEHPVVNKLDARFADADGDLVADAPKSEKDFIDPPTLTFCYVTGSADPAPYKQAWSDFTKHLSEVTGKPVEYAAVDSDQDEAKALRAMRDGTLQVAGFNTGRVGIAVDACGFVPVALLGGDAKSAGGKTHTEIIVPADSSIQTLADLKGHILALTDPESNSGYKAPVVFLADHGLRYGKDYEPRYTGGHDASIAGIAAHRYDAAAVAADLLQRALATGAIKKDQYRSIFQSEPFPTAGLGYAHNLKPELAKKIRDAMLSYSWKGTTMEKFFTDAGQSGLAPLNYKDDFSIVRRVDNAIGFDHAIK
jgi:phosphonate transport system substrate-binding protein